MRLSPTVGVTPAALGPREKRRPPRRGGPAKTYAARPAPPRLRLLRAFGSAAFIFPKGGSLASPGPGPWHTGRRWRGCEQSLPPNFYGPLTGGESPCAPAQRPARRAEAAAPPQRPGLLPPPPRAASLPAAPRAPRQGLPPPPRALIISKRC